MSNEQIINQGFLYCNGLDIAYASTTSITVTAGQVRDTTNVYDINVGNFLGFGFGNGSGTPSVTTTLNTTVVGLNGLDTGTIAVSTGYYVYAIGDPGLFHAPGIIISKTAPSIGPLMPFGYGIYRAIGWVLTDSSAHILPFYSPATNQSQRYFQWDAPIAVLSAGTSTSHAAIDLSVAMPSAQFGMAILQAAFTSTTAADTAKFRPTGATADWLTITGAVSGGVLDEQFQILPLLAAAKPEIDYILSAAGALTVLLQGYMFQV
jgi:hypothetical protein